MRIRKICGKRDGLVPVSYTHLNIREQMLIYGVDEMDETIQLIKEKKINGSIVCLLYTSVNAVAPGFIQPAMTDTLSEDVQANAKNNIPMKKFGSVQDLSLIHIYWNGWLFNIVLC